MLDLKKSILDPELAIACDLMTVTDETSVTEVIQKLAQARAVGRVKNGRNAQAQADDLQTNIQTDIEKSCVVVVNEQQEPIGIVTERDIVRLTAEKRSLEGVIVQEVMAQPLITLRRDEFQDIFAALNLFRQHHIRHLPIVTNQRQLVGIVTHESLRQQLQPTDLLHLRTVNNVMVSQPVQASPATTVLELAQLMAQHCVSCVVITEPQPAVSSDRPDTEGKVTWIPIGVITEQDIVQCQSVGLSLATTSATTIMTTPVRTLMPQDSLWQAQLLMEQYHLKRLPVVGNQGELVGILTQTSLLEALDPLDLSQLVEVMEAKVQQLEAEKVQLLQYRAEELEKEVQARTQALEHQATRDRLIAQLSTRIRRTLDLQDILDTTVADVQAFLQCDRIVIYRFEPDWSGFIIAEARNDQCPSILGQHCYDEHFASELTEAYRNGRTQVTHNIYTDALTDCHIELLESLTVQATIVVPIRQGHQLWGLLAAQTCFEPRNWEPENVELLQQIADQVGIAIQQSELYARSQAELRERQHVQHRLIQERNLTAAILDVTNTIVVVLDCQGCILRFNPAAEQVSGYTAEELIGQHVCDRLIPPDEIQLVCDGLEHLFAGNAQPNFENHWLTRDGERRLISWDSNILYDDQGQPEYLVGTGIDITDSRKATLALQESEERFRQLAENIQAVFWLVDLATDQFIYISPACERFWGQPPEFFYQDISRFLASVHPDDREQVRLAMQRERLDTVSHELEFRIIKPDASLCWVLERVFCIDNDQNKPYRLVGIIEDITERKLAEQALQASEAQQRAILAAIPDLMFRVSRIGQYLGYVTHHRDLDVLNSSFDPTGLLMRDVLPPVLAERQLSAIQTALTTGSLQVYEQEVDVNGTLQYEEIRIVPSGADEVLFMIRNISNRKQAELALQALNRELEHRVEQRTQALQQSESQFRAIFNQAAVGICYVALDGRYLQVNQALCNITGYSESELLQLTFQEITHPNDLQAHLDQTQKLLRGELSTFSLTKRYFRKDQTWIWVNLTVSLTYTAQGEPESIIAVVEDINDRKQAEIELHERTIAMQNAIEGISRIDPSGVYQEVNRAYADLYGYHPSEMLGMSWTVTCHPDDLPSLLEAYQRMQHQGKSEKEARGIRKDGSLFYKQITMVSAYNERGDFSGHHCFMKDISDRKQSELVLRRQIEREQLIITITQRIRESLNLDDILNATVTATRDILQSDRVIIFQLQTTDTGQVVTESVVNPDWSMLGTVIQESCFKTDLTQRYLQGYVTIVNDTDQEITNSCYRSLLNTYHVKANLVVPLIQGQALWGLLIAQQCSEPRSWQPYEVELLKQITTQVGIAIQQSELYQKLQTELQEREQAQETLRQTNQQLVATNQKLAEATRHKNEFLANMSHELRTPLNSILGLSEVLQEQVYGEMNERQVRSLRTIYNNGNHLLELINDVLDVAKIESGKVSLQRQPISIQRLCEETLALVKQDAQTKNVLVTSKFTHVAGQINVDKRRLRQALLNLLSNAIKFTPEGGRISLDVSGNPAVKTVTIRVKDTGIGIASQDIKKLFQSFVQLDGSLSRRYPGTGLGLVLVKQLVELHGGTVEVESVPGEGSCFSIVLPWESVPVAPASSPNYAATDSPAIALDSPQQPIRLLIAEDNSDNIETMLDYLQIQGFNIRLAQSGAEVIQMARDERPDLIVMDIQMPDLDGIEATRQIRADQDLATLPIIALTALAGVGDRDHCLEAGANGYLAKPFRLRELVDLIHHCLQVP